MKWYYLLNIQQHEYAATSNNNIRLQISEKARCAFLDIPSVSVIPKQ